MSEILKGADTPAARFKRRMRLEDQLKWMKLHGCNAYPVHAQRVDDGKKLQSLMIGLKSAENPRNELTSNILFASDNPRESVSYFVTM